METKYMKPKALIHFLMFFMMLFLVGCGEEEKRERDEVVTEIQDTEELENVESWDYENTDWEGDNECQTAVQSPINIDTSELIEAKLGDITYNYSPFEMNIVDNGYTIQVSGTEDSFITVSGKKFIFRQFHFHSPSEHTVNGNTYPMEMHLVHQEEGTSNLAVLGVFVEESGTTNEFLEKVFSNIPQTEKEEMETDVMLNLSDYIPPTQEFYTYIGSLTTPPCTVGVDWILFKEPIQASAEQIQNFSQIHGNSARPVLPLNNRRVLTNLEE